MQQRVERVKSLLIREVSNVILEEIQDKDIGFVTVIHADVSRDLRSARIYYSVLGDEDVQKTTEIAMKRHAKQIKFLVNNRINLRYAVQLLLIRESGAEHAVKIQSILEDIKEKLPNHTFEEPEEPLDESTPNSDEPKPTS
ncbi:MAG: ribosome-binding factor A [Candidatus Omnitrophota bacterium]|jgi:ribosome-binding factor A